MTDYIKNKLLEIIKDHVKKNGIVIWYDPEKVYADLIKQSDFGNIPFFKYEGSYYDLRFKIEEYFCKDEKPELVIYVGNKRDNKNYPLIELEVVGTILSSDSHDVEYDENTSLSLIVEKILTCKVSAENIKKIREEIELGNINLEEAEKEIEDIFSSDFNVLYTIFGIKDNYLILISFLCDEKFDNDINTKHAINELEVLIDKLFGITLNKVSNLKDLRNKLAEYIIISDFLISINKEELNEKFSGINLKKEETILKNIQRLVFSWRNNLEFEESYKVFADEIEVKFHIDKLQLELDEILKCETFNFIEHIIISELFNLGTRKIDTIFEIINIRKKTYWPRINPQLFLIYELIESGYILIDKINESLKILNNPDLDFNDYIKYYTGENDYNGWYLIDRYYRILNGKYLDFEFEHKYEDEVEPFYERCKNNYKKYIEKQIEKFSSKFNVGEYLNNKKFLNQNKIFSAKIEPSLISNKKIAYYLVDAFRFEMGKEFYETMTNYEKHKMNFALAGLPTITSIGMLELILGSNGEISLYEENNKLNISVDGNIVNDRAQRIAYLEKKVKDEFYVVKLDETIKPKKSIREKLKKYDLVIVTSQEIDKISEDTGEILAKEIMDKIFDYIKKSINYLNSLGFEEFIISADHGYLYGDVVGKDSKIEIPNGNTVALHKRVWIGMGGNNPISTKRIRASDLGYDSNLDFVFPLGYTVFKTAGQENNYIHGGISLQEIIIPVIEYYIPQAVSKSSSLEYRYNIIFPKEAITNRIFTVKVSYSDERLFIEEVRDESKKVRVLVKSENKIIGQAEAAGFGFNDSTKEIGLKKDEDNIITIILDEKINEGFADIVVVDTETDIELTKISGIPIKIMI